MDTRSQLRYGWGGEVIRCHALRDYNNCTSTFLIFLLFFFFFFFLLFNFGLDLVLVSVCGHVSYLTHQ